MRNVERQQYGDELKRLYHYHHVLFHEQVGLFFTERGIQKNAIDFLDDYSMPDLMNLQLKCDAFRPRRMNSRHVWRNKRHTESLHTLSSGTDFH